MTEVTITTLPAVPLHVFEIWSNAAAVAKRFKAATGFALPATGRSGGNDALRLIRFEPTVWLVEGDASALSAILSDDGAVTAIGGGIVRDVDLANARDLGGSFRHRTAVVTGDQQVHFAQLRCSGHHRERRVGHLGVVMFDENQSLH